MNHARRVYRWPNCGGFGGHAASIPRRWLPYFSRALALTLIAVAAGLCRPADAQQAADELVAQLERLEPHADVAPTVRALLDGIREEGRKVEAKGRFGTWTLGYVEAEARKSVDPSPRLLSAAASKSFVVALSNAYMSLFRANTLIGLGDEPDAVFASVEQVLRRIDERVVGAGVFEEKARRELKLSAEYTIVGIPGSPPWAPDGQTEALMSLVDTTCAEVQEIAMRPAIQGKTSHENLGWRVRLLSDVQARFVDSIVALRRRDWAGGLVDLSGDLSKWTEIGRGYPDSMEQPMLEARRLAREFLNGSRELSGESLPGLPFRDYLKWLDAGAQQHLGLTASILGSLVATASRESVKLEPGQSRDVDFVWSADGTPVMACRGTIARGPDGSAVVFGPMTATGWRFTTQMQVMEFGPYGADVLAGSILSWDKDARAARIDAPVHDKTGAQFWGGGSSWSWYKGYNDPTPSWMTHADRIAPLIAASAKTGLDAAGTRIPALRLTFRLHYDFRLSRMRGVTEFDRDATVDLFAEPGVVLVDPVAGALAAATIDHAIRLDVFPQGQPSPPNAAQTAREICESAPDRVAMKRVVAVDAGVEDPGAVEAYSAEALARGDRMYAFLLDEAEFRRRCKAADEAGKSRTIERLCRQLGLRHDHRFRTYVDQCLQATSAPRFEGVTRSCTWLRSIPEELWHHRLHAASSAQERQVTAP
jgi:hypothetical protein